MQIDPSNIITVAFENRLQYDKIHNGLLLCHEYNHVILTFGFELHPNISLQFCTDFTPSSLDRDRHQMFFCQNNHFTIFLQLQPLKSMI